MVLIYHIDVEDIFDVGTGIAHTGNGILNGNVLGKRHKRMRHDAASRVRGIGQHVLESFGLLGAEQLYDVSRTLFRECFQDVAGIIAVEFDNECGNLFVGERFKQLPGNMRVRFGQDGSPPLGLLDRLEGLFTFFGNQVRKNLCDLGSMHFRKGFGQMGPRLTTQKPPDHVLDTIESKVALVHHDTRPKNAADDLGHAPGGKPTGIGNPALISRLDKPNGTEGRAPALGTMRQDCGAAGKRQP